MPSKRDFRKLSLCAQAEARRIAVEMVKAGGTHVAAAVAVGGNRRFVGQWVRAEKQLGATALTSRRRGRQSGEQKALPWGEEQKVRKLVTDKSALNVGTLPGVASKRLIQGRKRKLFLILGSSPRPSNLIVHRAKAVAAWVKEHSDLIELFYLPPQPPARTATSCSTTI